ncbi:MAG: hypothetical protein V3575_02525 [Candidatus Absconditabacteria bacterium]
MKMFFLKSTFFSLILSFSLLITYILVKGWNGLQATEGDTLTVAKWNELASSSSSAPSGAVMAFNLATCPAGRKPADGTNGTPDLRGEFIRGLDNGRGVDVDRELGDYQQHDWKSFNADNVGRNTRSYSHGPVYMGKATDSYVGNLFIGYRANPSASLGIKWDDSEIRPRNVALLYCVKE